MDFIERVFGISLDGGNGLYETCLLLAPVVILTLFYIRRRRIARHRQYD